MVAEQVEKDFKKYMRLDNNMSGITAVIDNRIFNLGYEA